MEELIGLLILVALAFAFIPWARHLSTDFLREQRPEPPLDVLRRRYAAGEITREQFEAMRNDLEHDSRP